MASKVKLKPYSRGVSIIGVGCTPFMFTLDNEKTNGLCEGELFGYAALEAMEDAGLEPSDVEFYYHGQALPSLQSDYITQNMQVANWFGMKGKASVAHSEACCTGYVALEQAVTAVASGAYDIVLSGACDMSDARAVRDKPAHIRARFTTEEFIGGAIPMVYSRDYTRGFLASNAMVADGWIMDYARENNLSDQQIDDALNSMAVNCRRASSLNPLALMRTPFEQEAAEAGFDNVMDYMRSPYNPFLSQYLRVTGFEQKCDGAAAVIVCPTEIAHRYSDHPIEVLGIGHACLEGIWSYLERDATLEAYRQVKELTGLTGEDMDLFLANDFFIASHLVAAEACEYLPKGHGWEYAIEGRTAFDGDKPINTNGGRCHFGHAHGTSGLGDIYEAVKQMRGLMGPTQLAKTPKKAMLRGFGGGQNVICAILNGEN